MGVQSKSQAGLYTLTTFEPPYVERTGALYGNATVKSFQLPANFTGQTIAIRFTCEGVNPGDAKGVYCGFDDISVSPTQSPVTTTTSISTTTPIYTITPKYTTTTIIATITSYTTTPASYPPPTSGFGGANALFLVLIGLGVGLADVAIARSLFRPAGNFATCPFCGARTSSSSPYRQRCGAQLWSRWNHCSRCGTYLPNSARYCAICGLDSLSHFGSNIHT